MGDVHSSDGEGPRAEAIVVTGVPGAGKTTLARSLARELSAPLLSLDLIKEHLYRRAAGMGDRYGLRLAAESELRRELANTVGTVVVDVWIAPGRDTQRLAALFRESTSCTVEVLCRVPADVAVDRYSRRVRTGPHLPPDSQTLRRIREAVDLLCPMGIGRSVEIDTSRHVDIELVREHLYGEV